MFRTIRKLGSYLVQDFKKQMRSEKGTWAAIAMTVVGAGVSYGSQAMQKKSTGGKTGYDVVTPASIGESSGTGKYMADYFQKAMEGFATGDPWRGYGDYEQLMKRKLQRGQQEAMYGTQGNRYGAYQTGMEAGALTGLGGAATAKSLRPLQSQYLTGSQAIDEYIASQKANAMQTREQTMLQTGMGLSSPYAQQIVPYNQPAQEAQTSPWASILGSIGGSMMSSGIGGIGGGGGGGAIPVGGTRTNYGGGAYGTTSPIPNAQYGWNVGDKVDLSKLRY